MPKSARFDGIASPAVQRLAECPKTMTNGPCGGVADDGSCEVASDHRCVWWDARDEAVVTRPSPRPPIDWSVDDPWPSAFAGASPTRLVADTLDRTNRPQRTGSRLEHLLADGAFVVTCELNPPDSAAPDGVLASARALLGTIDAVHVSDNSLASPHMCGLALAALVERLGMETILHMTCRDRNRNMLQADLLGAAALGVRHVLCLTGDHPAIGDHPEAKPVFDLDAVSWIDTARQLRDDRALLSGRPLISPPRLLIGGGAEPTSPPIELRPQRLAVKVAAGIDFAVTQVVYDMALLRRYLDRVRDLGLLDKIHLLVSVGALAGPSMARGMNSSTPGVSVPKSIIARLEAAPPRRRRVEGLRICVEQIQELLETPGVSGVDIMDVEPGRYLEIVEAAGLTARRRAAR